ncbi:protein rhomboid-like, partial [Tropilaelaps mercedesae]
TGAAAVPAQAANSSARMKPLLPSTTKTQKPASIEVDPAPAIVSIDDVTSGPVNAAPSASDDKYFADQYSCRSPPLFIVLITLAELSIFVYYWLSFKAQTIQTEQIYYSVTAGVEIAVDSPFIYRPDRRYEVWRFVLYMLLHAGWVHLLINLSVQLIVGLPLELVHGSWRVGCIYMSGVLAGSLSTSVFDSEVYLIGASGGVYALLTTHLANVMLNHRCMQFAWMRIAGVFITAGSDVALAFYNRYVQPKALPVSYVAHLAGALAGLTAGLLLLRNFEKKFHEHILWWTALVMYSACMLFAVLYNVFNIDGIATPEEIF